VSTRSTGRLHPSGTFGYLISNYVSPDDLERFDATTSPVEVGPDSPYHGDYPMGAPIWFTEDGGSIITASGDVFVSSNDPALDMRYSGTLGLGTYDWAAHSSAAGKIATLRTEYNNVFDPIDWLLRIYTDNQLTLVRSESLPDTPYNSVFYRSAGRFVAFSADSTKLFVIARAVNAAGSVHALYTYQP
jgi:chitinase